MLFFAGVFMLLLSFWLHASELENAELKRKISDLEHELKKAKDEIFDLENKED